jgi:hypothetical protein
VCLPKLPFLDLSLENRDRFRLLHGFAVPCGARSLGRLETLKLAGTNAT